VESVVGEDCGGGVVASVRILDNNDPQAVSRRRRRRRSRLRATCQNSEKTKASGAEERGGEERVSGPA
jgi:hypothetical protein